MGWACLAEEMMEQRANERPLDADERRLNLVPGPEQLSLALPPEVLGNEAGEGGGLLPEGETSHDVGSRLDPGEAAEHAAVSLGEWAAGLAVGDTCFSCGEGRLTEITRLPGFAGSPALRCPGCGAEISQPEAA